MVLTLTLTLTLTLIPSPTLSLTLSPTLPLTLTLPLSQAAGLALRACVVAGTWREAAQVLEATDAGAAPPPRAQLLEALRCTPHAAPLPADADALASLHAQACCMHGSRACVVHAWCMHGACMVHAWCMHGACMVHAWCSWAISWRSAYR